MLKFLMDQQVPAGITLGLCARGVDVLTAFEDGSHELPDPLLLDRAAILERVLFSRDADFLIEANKRLQSGVLFVGVVYAHQLRVSIGQCVDDLELIAKLETLEGLRDSVTFLPL
jgi:predicted nuclease of predicted toxin-antitoxin system